MNDNLNRICWMAWVVVLVSVTLAQAGAQVLTGEQVKKLAPNSYYFAGQSAAVQVRNTAGLKNSAGKVVLAGLVDTTGYSTATPGKNHGFPISEAQHHS